MNLKAIIFGGVTTFLMFIVSTLVLLFFGSILGETPLLVLAFALTTASIILGSAAAARRAGERHVLHGMLAAMVCLNLVFPIAVFYGSRFVTINTETALAGILNYCLFGSIGGLLAKLRG